MTARAWSASVLSACVTVAPAGTADAGAADALARLQRAGTLRVGTPAVQTLDGRPEAAPPTGFEADLYAEIGRALGVRVRWVALPRGRLLSALDGCQIDVAAEPAGVSGAAGPRYRLLPPVADAGDGLLTRRGDASVRQPSDLAGKAVGAVRGSRTMARLRAFAATLPGRMTVRPYASAAAARDDVAAGRLAAVAGPLVELAGAARFDPRFEAVTPTLGPSAEVRDAVPGDADHATMAAAVGAAILAMTADGRLAALQRAWFGRTMPPVQSSPVPPPAQPMPSPTTSKP